MQCKFCGNDTKVVDKRDNGGQTRRRRECLSCGKRFTTYETIDLDNLVVIKKDGARQQFDRNKVKSGLITACEKRPVPMETIEHVVQKIEEELRKKYSNEVPSKAIGETVMAKLRQLDKVAYIRFASVYRNFTDLSSFETELKSLKQEKERPVLVA